jgi:opacity protein-like surface antigen
MKKVSGLIVALLLFVFQVFSQDKGYIAVSLGPSIPLSDFASKDIDKESAGFAKTGAIFDISFGYKIGKNFGVAALLRGQANKTDAQAMADEMGNKLSFQVDTKVESKSWSIGAFMLGGYATVPLEKKLSLESRIMFGIITATYPNVTFTFSDAEESVLVKRTGSTATSFAYQIGAGIRYDVGKRLCLLANFDYLGSNPEFKDVETTAETSTSFERISKDTFSQSFGTFNIGVGVGYRL